MTLKGSCPLSSGEHIPTYNNQNLNKSQLEMITPLGKMGSEMDVSLRRTMNPMCPFQLELFTQGGHSSKELEFLQVL